MAQELFDSQDWIRAADRGDAEAVGSMLAAGTDADARTHGSETALMRAAARGHTHLVRLLLERGADPNLRRRDGWTALMLAAFFGHAETARELVRRGADVEASDRNGSTAFKWASSRGHVEVARLLGEASPAATPPAKAEAPAETRRETNTRRETTAAAPRPQAPTPERAPEIHAAATPPPTTTTTTGAAPRVEPKGAAREEKGGAREESDEVTIAAAVRSPAAAPAATAPAQVPAQAHTPAPMPLPAEAHATPAASIFERGEELRAERIVVSPEVRREVTAAAARAARSADGGARFWRAAALGMALLAIVGATLAYRFGGAGAPSPAEGARVAPTPEAPAQPAEAIPAEAQPALPVTPIASPLPTDPAALGAASAGLTPGAQPSVPTYFPPATSDAATAAPPVESARPRETYPVNQPAGRTSGGEPALVNRGQAEQTSDDAASPARRPQDSGASDNARADAPTPRPARDDTVQRSSRPARTADEPRPAPTPKGKVVNWP